MRSLKNWLDEYSESHQNRTNKVIHWICVPLIMFSIILLLWSIPVPAFLAEGGVNWAYVFLWLAVGYYFFLSASLGIGMLLVLFGMIYLTNLLNTTSNYPMWGIGLILFITAWSVQLFGHKMEGKKPKFLTDVQFLLIGPLWLLQSIYKKLGIPI
jgi:uncharacterized membrane protein YGL010W